MYSFDVRMLLLNAYNYGDKGNEKLKYIIKRRDFTFNYIAVNVVTSLRGGM